MDKNLNVRPHESNTADADYWLTAPKKEVKKFIEENTQQYEIKKKEILCKIQNKAKHLEQ